MILNNYYVHKVCSANFTFRHAKGVVARYQIQQKMDELRQKQQEAFDIIAGKRSPVASAEMISMAGIGEKSVKNVRNLHSAVETESLPSPLVTIKKSAPGNDIKLVVFLKPVSLRLTLVSRAMTLDWAVDISCIRDPRASSHDSIQKIKKINSGSEHFQPLVYLVCNRF